MGYRCFALLLRFISFCQRHNLDPREYGYIYQMIEVGDYSELAGKPAPPPYRFVLLELREWTRRLARFPETRHTTINNEPPWFFDYEQGEYISYFLPLDEELASETDLRVEKAQQETWQDYKERRDADTKQRGLESYSGKRSDTHDYWIYLYKVKGLSSDEINPLRNSNGGCRRQDEFSGWVAKTTERYQASALSLRKLCRPEITKKVSS